jgi:hypothetical protein
MFIYIYYFLLVKNMIFILSFYITREQTNYYNII